MQCLIKFLLYSVAFAAASSPPSAFSTAASTQPYSQFYKEAQILKSRYNEECKDFELWEIAAFLSPSFAVILFISSTAKVMMNLLLLQQYKKKSLRVSNCYIGLILFGSEL